MTDESLIRLIKSKAEEDVQIAWEILIKMKEGDLIAFFKKYYTGDYNSDMVLYGLDFFNGEEDFSFMERCYYKKGNVYLYIYHKGVTLESRKQMESYVRSNIGSVPVYTTEDY